MTGGRSCSKVQRNRRLTSHQRKVAADFLARRPSPAEQRAYEAGWRSALAYEELSACPAPADDRARQERERALRRLSHKIVPANKQAAARSRAEIHRAALRHLRECGGVDNFNISAFIRDVRSNPACFRVYRNSAKPRPLTDHAIRTILKRRLDITGEPGRKPKKT